jgi:hypothetical protein
MQFAPRLRKTKPKKKAVMSDGTLKVRNSGLQHLLELCHPLL